MSHEQKLRLTTALKQCITKLTTTPYPKHGEYCNRTWDSIMCWMDTPVGTVARQPCPSYITNFNKCKYATRTCLPDGTWYRHPKHNTSWTNYTECKTLPEIDSNFSPIVAAHLPKIQLLSNIGYGISLGALLLAVMIMLVCRRLRSKSNVLHVNLFLAFILRAVMWFVRETLLVESLGLPSDVERTGDGCLRFIEDGTHWQCKLIFTMLHYSLGTSYMWIFAEGIYLHMLVYNTLWTERNGVKPYMVFGWVSPLLFLFPWVIVRAVCEDVLCWNTHPTPAFYWIMKGPIVASIVINSMFFVNIVRILTIRASHRQDENRYRKLAKFTLVLIPLSGVIYIVFVALPPEPDVPFMYAEMFLNSFQGFILALLFCFLNEEVHMELKKLWARHKMRRRDSYLLTRSWVFSSTHASARRKGSTRHGHNVCNDSTVHHNHSVISAKGDKPIINVGIKCDGDVHGYEMRRVCNGKQDKGKRKVFSFKGKESDSNRSDHAVHSHHSDRSSDSKSKPEAV